jgi:amino acid transporter
LKQTLQKINWLSVAQIVLVFVLMLAPVFAHAQLNRNFACDPSAGLNCNAGTTVNDLIRTIINWALGIAFGVAVLFLIIGGFWFITAQGNEEQSSKGRKTVVNAIIGIIIIVLSYVIVSVVSNFVSGRTTGP